jgi:hypothetical protein
LPAEIFPGFLIQGGRQVTQIAGQSGLKYCPVPAL